MSCETCLTALHVAYARVTSPAAIAAFCKYEPPSVHEFPLMYTVLDRWEFTDEWQRQEYTWHYVSTLCLRWQESEEADKEVRAYINSVCATVIADKQLTGELASQGGWAQIQSGRVGWGEISKTKIRFIEFEATIHEVIS
jgi:hypothetical protein